MKKLIVLLLTAVVLFAFAPQKQLKWMAIGDSITYHNNHLESTKGILTKGYMDRVVDKLPYVKFANHGYPGWTAQGIAENFDNLHLEKADVYTLFLGTNDWWVGLPIGTGDDYRDNTGPKSVYGAYRVIIDKIRQQNSEAKIVLLTPLQRTDFIDINNVRSIIHGSYKPNRQGVALSAYTDAIKNIAQAEKLELVDLYYKSGITVKNAVKYKRLRKVDSSYQNYVYPKYIDLPFNPDEDEYPYPTEAIDWTYDGLHPSDKGHQKIADMLVKLMKKY
ncbi:SGNH/GDSL hydrolase family protein [Mucilaginibacter antarcticus]|uniref:SGNH/GDSL hydrolase family protein n=1 Tax=Mucilaginibacter antarcticus TaxID=1855725 RepID=A0ABW5XLX8_9SPHI